MARFAAILGIVLVVFAAVLIVFGLVISGLTRAAPALEMELAGSSWTIDSVDGEPAGVSAVLHLDADGVNGTVDLPCGEVPLVWAWDTDGSALGFGINAAECRGDDPSQTIVHSLRGVDEWAIDDADRIRLLGQQEVRLSRQPNE